MRRDLFNIGALVTMVLVLAVGGPWLAREVKSLPRQSLAARAGQRVVTLEVGGMTCSGCASAVQASLDQVPGVATTLVRLQQRRAYIVCDLGVPDTSLVAAVHRAGPGFLAAVAAR
ncbi:MAG: heavy-metal-associated domain-containing protein [Candidatus Eisenbacteria bacterium]|uniref:Heavy-metal-associated domain-containing protein n=1 Tax=Eiseniibacteriota bacterium TaxID=2212470 RepID=A0A9D6L6X2_UNCEI|nr:heavy-metal-associated domain-containing protein [Candidatus Eisenbacteria bacterium]MBI3540028.1 heavy-metal-associated domain-containing protein [Candidatus Eisenbacteria bacterium]